ncbi:MAG TPA: hypothetical protein VK997_11740, partial [Deferrisomatales bacterium]|nr:hypothetical protein [Deferrisomatales bacterium]
MGCALGLAWAAPTAAASRTRPLAPPLNEPVPVTAEADPVAGVAVSRDGLWLAYGAGRGRFRDLWLRSADPNVVVLPRQLTFDPGDEHSPAFSPDGRWLAYVGTGHDAKGDLYLLDLKARTTPVRLTGRETADGGPCFSPDGRSLLYHRAAAGAEPSLAEVSLGPNGAASGPARTLETGGPAWDPAPSPDGRRVAFVSRRADPGGDLFLLDRGTGEVTPLTRGPEVDTAPTWTVDGQTVFFARRAVDTDGDGVLTEGDRAAVYRMAPGSPESGAHPLTAASARAEHPLTAPSGDGPKLYFLSDRGGVPNVWRLPAEGEIPARPTAREQLDLAGEIAALVPADPLRTALAFARVRERFAAEPATATRATFAMANVYRLAGYTAAAAREYRGTLERGAGAPAPVLPEEALARIFLARLDGTERWRRATTRAEQDTVLARTLEALQGVADGYPHSERVQARAQVEQARWLLERGDGVGAVLETTRRLDRVIEGDAHLPDLAAEALLLRADALARAGDPAAVVPAYRRVLESYPEEDAAALPATRKLLDLALEAAHGTEEQVRFLRQLAEENRGALPPLAAGALNRSGDLLYTATEWVRAKGAYRQVLDEFPGQTSQRAAARLA